MKQGLFELADGGTLFIDEFGEMSAGLQVKLLRVLQDGTMRRVGSVTEQRVEVRVIAATNRDLEKEVAQKNFREDLFYRINVLGIHVPPLRNRRSDIPLLVDFFHRTRLANQRRSPVSTRIIQLAGKYSATTERYRTSEGACRRR